MFVFGSVTPQATKVFQEVHYLKEGALAFLEDLKVRACQLVCKPDESTMISQFRVEIPAGMQNHLTNDKQLDLARHRLQDFIQMLHRREEATKVTRTTNLAINSDKQLHIHTIDTNNGGQTVPFLVKN